MVILIRSHNNSRCYNGEERYRVEGIAFVLTGQFDFPFSYCSSFQRKQGVTPRRREIWSLRRNEASKLIKLVKTRVEDNVICVVADGVAYAPHHAVDIAKWGVDCALLPGSTETRPSQSLFAEEVPSSAPLVLTSVKNEFEANTKAVMDATNRSIVAWQGSSASTSYHIFPGSLKQRAPASIKKLSTSVGKFQPAWIELFWKQHSILSFSFELLEKLMAFLSSRPSCEQEAYNE
ncbi:hypothetical protein R1flu_025075 [Riccia fluitans]|uniref:Ribosomal protein S2 n=1 Tax=Riccia fluitans TaxID=41844 RepID=A0ABD1XXN0_9MARC